MNHFYLKVKNNFNRTFACESSFVANKRVRQIISARKLLKLGSQAKVLFNLIKKEEKEIDLKIEDLLPEYNKCGRTGELENSALRQNQSSYESKTSTCFANLVRRMQWNKE